MHFTSVATALIALPVLAFAQTTSTQSGLPAGVVEGSCDPFNIVTAGAMTFNNPDNVDLFMWVKAAHLNTPRTEGWTQIQKLPAQKLTTVNVKGNPGLWWLKICNGGTSDKYPTRCGYPTKYPGQPNVNENKQFRFETQPTADRWNIALGGRFNSGDIEGIQAYCGVGALIPKESTTLVTRINPQRSVATEA